jgi:secondary thiamine-phosphate synthase enzyme
MRTRRPFFPVYEKRRSHVKQPVFIRGDEAGATAAVRVLGEEDMQQMLVVATARKDEIVDITDSVEAALDEAAGESGVCVVFAAHTTCAITTADLDPGTDLDLLQALRALLPQMSYRHSHDPEHAPDHILSAIIGPSVAIPYAGRRLLLGTWQRVVLVELDGPRQRTVHVTAI